MAAITILFVAMDVFTIRRVRLYYHLSVADVKR